MCQKERDNENPLCLHCEVTSDSVYKRNTAFDESLADTHTQTSPGQQEECEIGKVNPELIDRSGPRLSDFICLAFQTERRTNRDEAGMRNAKD